MKSGANHNKGSHLGNTRSRHLETASAHCRSIMLFIFVQLLKREPALLNSHQVPIAICSCMAIKKPRVSKRKRVNHSIVAFSSWSMLYQHTRHRNSNKLKTLCQKLASVFVLSVAQTTNCRRNYQIFTSSRKTLKMTFFHRYALHFKNYLFLMKNYCTMPYENLRFWHLIT